MSTILNIISVLGTFLTTFGLLFLFQRFTIGLIPLFKKEIKKTITLGDLVFTLTSLLFVFAFVDFYRPY